MNRLLFATLLAPAAFSGIVFSQTEDFAEGRHASDWLRHPVYGDPSFDAFERLPGNPIHRGAPPFDWPVNGFLFADPPSGHWHVFVGDYGKGYVTPPSRCLLYRSANHGLSWTNLGVVLHGDPQMFDRGGHTPDVSVVCADGRYHMVYDWGEPDFNAEGGLAYAWAERPEGPWHRAPQPITRNSMLSKLSGRYQRTYAATLLRRKDDWLILGMMDHAPHSWALFAMTAPKPDGPYSERRLVRQVEEDYFHPPLLEFFPAFEHDGFVCAPATSVALNRDFNALFRAPLEHAEEPSAWTLFHCGSVWHSEDREAEHFGIWGQTFSGFVDAQGTLQAMFPSRDAQGRGTINLAQRPWKEPFREHGFVLSGHQGPALTLLRRAYDDFALDAELQLRGTLRLLLDYAAPLGPNTPSSDATLHPLMNTRHLALELAPGQWRLLRQDVSGQSETLASGRLEEAQRRILRVQREAGRLALKLDGRELWAGRPLPGENPASTGVLGLRLDPNSHVVVERFRIEGTPKPAWMSFLWTEALLGAGESPADWTETRDSSFRYASGVVSKVAAARAKWNIIGGGFRLWSPRGPGYGSVEVRVDGQSAATLDLLADQEVGSQPVWSVADLPDTFHAVVLVAKSRLIPVDCLEVTTGAVHPLPTSPLHAADPPSRESAETPVLTRAEMEVDLDHLTVRLKRAWAYADDKRVWLGVDIDALHAAALRELGGVRDADGFYFLVRKYVGGLMDGHAGVRPGHSSPGISTPTRWPFAVTRLDGRFYVKALEGGGGPLRPGDELLSVNGVPLRDRFETALARSTGSTPAGRECRALGTMRGGAETKLRIEGARPGGSNFACELPALCGDEAAEEQIRWRKLEGNVGCLRLPSFVQDRKIWEQGDRSPAALLAALEPKKTALRQAFAELKDTRALILDLRGNGGGSDALGHFLAHCLCDTKAHPVYYALSTRVSEDLLALPEFAASANMPASADNDRSQIQLLPEKGVCRYAGKLAVLMDEGCFSACDCFLNYLSIAAPKTVFVGRPNGAGAGAPRPVVTLPHSKMVVTFCVMQVWNLNGQLIESRPLKPTVPVQWTVDDLLQGRDPDLEAALLYLERQKD